MKKEDYMKFSKERLAELLEERDNMLHINLLPPIIVQPAQPPCYAPDGICTNPFHDCINCPRFSGGVLWRTLCSSTSNTEKKE